MSEVDLGIVLGRVGVKNNANVVNVFTKQHGKKSFFLAETSKKNKKAPNAVLQPLSICELYWQQSSKSSLLKLNEARLSEALFEMQNDIYKSSTALLIAEILNAVLMEEGDPELFEFLQHSILLYNQMEEGAANFHLMFLMKLTRFLGFAPQIGTSNKVFDLKEGVFQSMQPNHPLYVSDLKSEQLSQFISFEWKNISLIKLSGKERSELLNVVIEYYQLHISGFRKPKSLSILMEIFS